MATRRTNTSELVLRLRACVLCHALFFICRSCDRGQRYCSVWCRFWAWREQRRQANRRHQRSRDGRADHRDRQRAYRKRCAQRRWGALGGQSAVSECVGNVPLQVEPRVLSNTLSSQDLPRSLPASQNETVSPKNVTDTTSPTLTSSAMIATRDSGSASAMPLRFSVAKTGSRRWLPGQKLDRELVPDGLRCMICGRCGYFVDPFPSFHFPTRRFDFDDEC